MSVTSDDTPRKQNRGKKVSVDRNDPSRFVEPGLNYRAKLIGVEDVPEPRGDKMCQVAMAKLKAAVKTIGDHKQKIMINITLQGIRLIDEKTESLIQFHPVHRISFISRDPSDSRAFGYIYGQTSGSHQFYGIKTEKVAEGIVISLRDLFQVVFEMKKQSNEFSKRTLGLEEQGLDQLRVSTSPKPNSGRKAWLKSEYWSQSVSLPSSNGQPSATFRGTTSVNSKHELPVSSASAQPSPNLSNWSTNFQARQGGFAGGLPRTSMTPEPIYQNSPILSGKLLHSAVTSATPPPYMNSMAKSSTPLTVSSVKSSTMGKSQPTSDCVRGWVSFELDAMDRSPTGQPLRQKSGARMKDPFANDPFFNRALESEEETVVWSKRKVEVSNVEPVYGHFVEPESSKDPTISSQLDASEDDHYVNTGTIASNESPAINYEYKEKVSTLPIQQNSGLYQASESVTNVISPEMPSQGSSCDLFNFPSPDAPPPPLPESITVSFDEQAPAIPPRPGSTVGAKTSFKNESTASRVDSDFLNVTYLQQPASSNLAGFAPTDPILSSNFLHYPTGTEFESLPQENTVMESGSGCEFPPFVPSRLPSGGRGSGMGAQAVQDPFAVMLLKRDQSQGRVTCAWTGVESLPQDSYLDSARKLEPFGTPGCVGGHPHGSFSSTEVQAPEGGVSSHSASIHNPNVGIHDPFSCLDPFTGSEFRSDPFVNDADASSFGSGNSDPFAKQFPSNRLTFAAHNPAADRFSDAFDDVFSSRDEFDKAWNSFQSPNVASGDFQGGPDIGSLRLTTTSGGVGVGFNPSDGKHPERDFVELRSQGEPHGPHHVSGNESAILNNNRQTEVKLGQQKQTSFDSILDDFTQRFPPFEDCWTALPESKSGQSKNNFAAAEGGDGVKPRLNVPKSSDSSSNSEIAEAFGDDQCFSSSRNIEETQQVTA